MIPALRQFVRPTVPALPVKRQAPPDGGGYTGHRVLGEIACGPHRPGFALLTVSSATEGRACALPPLFRRKQLFSSDQMAETQPKTDRGERR